MTKLEELKQRHAELKTQILEESKAWFKEASAGLFAKYPAMEKFSWQQYTPYFNDGEECTFSVHADEPDINGEEGYEISKDNDYSGGRWIPRTTFHPMYEAQKEVKSLIQSIDDATLKEMFGDHCEVICSRDKITVEEYSHD